MLSDKEKKEMLEDGRNHRRRRAFDHGRLIRDAISLDEYLSFLDDLQKIFSPFKISMHRTITKLNKL